MKTRGVGFLLAACVAAATSRLSAQGTTTGAITGLVSGDNGQPMQTVNVLVSNTTTGARARATTNASGRYFVSGLEVGAGYVVAVRSIGYRSATRDGIAVQLGQTTRADFKLERAATELQAVTVTANAADRDFAPTRQGAQTVVSDTLIARLPTLNRQLSDFVRISPNVAVNDNGRISAAGQNNRFNNIQVDGVAVANRFGLGASPELGAQAGGRSLSLDAIKEVQVLISPFDVRQGNFTGALVNAVTKNGTNTLSGSAFAYTRNEQLTRNDPFIRGRDFQQTMFGASIGGPIVKDRVHFFVLGEFQQQQSPAAGPFLGQPATVLPAFAAPQSAVDSIVAIASARGINPGSAGLVTNENPLVNTFARVDIRLNDRHRIVLRNLYNNQQQDDFGRSSAISNPVLALSSNGFRRRELSNSAVMQVFSNWGKVQNEFIVGLTNTRFSRVTPQEVPMITVQNVGGPNVSQVRFGTENNSQRNLLNEDLIELQNNLTYSFGNHTFTFGTRNEIYNVTNSFLQNSFGNYTFNNVGNWSAGVPALYSGSGGLGGDVIAKFRAGQFGAYWQDLWQPSARFSATYGMRLDLPVFFDQPTFTQRVQTDFNRSTSSMPRRQFQLSPRLGFNWQVDQNAAMQVRGGVGVFQGTPAYVWMSNQYQNNGSGLAQFSCGPGNLAGSAPAFTPDASAQPRGCGPLSGFSGAQAALNGTSGRSLDNGTLIGTVNLAPEDLRFPQVFRATLAMDRKLAWGVVGTLEGIYTKGVSDLFYTNINLPTDPIGTDLNGRSMYGSLPTTGIRSQTLRNPAYGPVLDISNQNNNYSYGFTTGLKKSWGRAFEGSFYYTYSRSYSVTDLTSSVALSNWQFGRAYSGRQEDTRVGLSDFDQPHRIVAVGSYTAPWTKFSTSFSFFYQSASGRPFAYVAGGAANRGDLNADGSNANDPIFVPISEASNGLLFTPVTLPALPGTTGARPFTAVQQQAAFNQFVTQLPCMDAQRGQIMNRNSCRNPDFQTMDVTLRQSLGEVRGNRVGLEVQVFNFLNFVNKDWGKVRSAGGNANVAVLQHTGNTVGTLGTSQPTFTFDPALVNTDLRFPVLQNAAAFYQIQAGIRYSF